MSAFSPKQKAEHRIHAHTCAFYLLAWFFFIRCYILFS